MLTDVLFNWIKFWLQKVHVQNYNYYRWFYGYKHRAGSQWEQGTDFWISLIFLWDFDLKIKAIKAIVLIFPSITIGLLMAKTN